MNQIDAASARRAELAKALADTRSKIPSTCTLIAVTKTFPLSDVKILYDLGERNFGENRDSEGSEKSSHLPPDAIWHFQGEIQSNKIRSIARWADYIHSLDDIGHAEKISAAANHGAGGKIVNVFIQINLDEKLESSNSLRGGISPAELDQFTDSISRLTGLAIVGVMGVAPLGVDPSPAFAQLQELSQELQNKLPKARFISAGMSGDFEVALKYGATHIRLGSSILGRREGHL